MGTSLLSCFFDSQCNEATNDTYESEGIRSGSHRAAVILKTVYVVISNYSKL